MTPTQTRLETMPKRTLEKLPESARMPSISKFTVCCGGQMDETEQTSTCKKDPTRPLSRISCIPWHKAVGYAPSYLLAFLPFYANQRPP